MSKVRDILEAAISDGVITREEHDAFIDAMSEDGQIDEEEQQLISSMFKLIKSGKLVVVDEERKKADFMRKLDKLKQEGKEE